MKSLGERLINARQKAGLTQDALAKKAGITRVAISKAEQGLTKVSTVTPFLKLQLHCGVHRSGFRTEMKKISIGKIMLRAAHRETQHTLTL